MSDNMIRYERDDEGIVTLTMDDPGAGANTMNDTYIAAMGETVDRLEAERDEIAGVVITSAKKTFFAGGNLTDLQSVTAETAGEFFTGIEGIKSQLRRLEQLGKPVVAAINGAALGGGLEGEARQAAQASAQFYADHILIHAGGLKTAICEGAESVDGFPDTRWTE